MAKDRLNIGYVIDNAEEIWRNITNSTSTRGTLLHASKLPKWKWLVGLYLFSVNKNISVRELAKTIGINKNSAHLMLQKIRYCLSQEDIQLIGETIIDECYIGGWQNKHLSLKWDYMRQRGFVDKNAKRYTKKQILAASSDYKQHVLCLIDSNCTTKLLHLPNPITKECIKVVLGRENGITSLVCDESKLYENCGLPIETNNHSKHQWLTTSGKSSNAVENRFSWTKRKIKYNTHTSEKYLQLYLNQFAWQNNVKELSKEDKYYNLLNIVVRKRVTLKELCRFNYRECYPKSRREKEIEELEFLQSAIGDFATVTLR